MRRDKSLQDFKYFNNTDKPKNVSSRDWNRRARVWREVVDEPKWSDRFVVEIVAYGRFDYIDPWLEMARADAKAGKLPGKL